MTNVEKELARRLRLMSMDYVAEMRNKAKAIRDYPGATQMAVDAIPNMNAERAKDAADIIYRLTTAELDRRMN